MCVTAWFKGEMIDCVSDLRRALGVVVIEDEEQLRAHIARQGGDLEETCLCVVDMEATARAAGLELEWGVDGGDPMEAELREPKA